MDIPDAWDVPVSSAGRREWPYLITSRIYLLPIHHTTKIHLSGFEEADAVGITVLARG
jgi:hypothetical protein